MIKWKICGLCAVAGATVHMSVAWRYDNKHNFWIWLIIAPLCGCIVAMLHGANARFKLKVAIPSALLGWTVLLSGYSAYYWREYYYYSGGEIDFPYFMILGAAAALLAVIVHMIKQPPVQPH